MSTAERLPPPNEAAPKERTFQEYKEEQRALFLAQFRDAYKQLRQRLEAHPPTSHQVTEKANGRQTVHYGDPMAGLSFEDLALPNRYDLFEEATDSPEERDAKSAAFLEAIIEVTNTGLREGEEDAARIFAQLMGDHFANEDLQHIEVFEHLTPAHALQYAVACSEWSFEQQFSESALRAFVKGTEKDAGRKGLRLAEGESLQNRAATKRVRAAFQHYLDNASTVDQVAFMNYAPTMMLNFTFMYDPEYQTSDDDFRMHGEGMFAEEALWTVLQQEDSEKIHPFVHAAHTHALSQIKMDTRQATYDDFRRIREVPLERFMPISKDREAKYDRSETIQRVRPGKEQTEEQTLDGAMKSLLPKRIADNPDAFRMLREFYRPWMMESLSDQINVDIRQLTFREQMQLFTFFAGADAQRSVEGFRAVSKHGLPAARAFLACEKDRAAADDILLIAEQAEPKDAEAVFAAFTRIADLLHTSSEELYQEVFANAQGERPSREAVDDEFISRARRILKDYAQTIRQQDTEKTKEVVERLEQLKTDTVLFASIFKAAFKGNPHVHFEDLRDMELQARRRVELDEDTQREMLAMAHENWRQDPQLRDLPVEALKQKLKGEEDDSLFYVLRKEGRPLAFMRFDERPDGDLYAGSLNVDPQLRGSAVGEAFLNAGLDQAAHDRPVHADFFPQVDAGMMYVDRFGWAVTGTEQVDLPEEQRTRRCTMIRDPQWMDKLAARRPNMTKEYLASLTEDPHAPFRVERFQFPQDQERFMDAIERAGREGLVMSRYFAEAPDGHSRLAVFEPKPHT